MSRWHIPSAILIASWRRATQQIQRARDFTAWNESMTLLQSNTRLARLHAVYHLCLFRQREHPRSFVPDPTQFPTRDPRPWPYIFSEAEIVRLLTTAEALPPRKGSPLHRRAWPESASSYTRRVFVEGNCASPSATTNRPNKSFTSAAFEIRPEVTSRCRCRHDATREIGCLATAVLSRRQAWCPLWRRCATWC